MSTNSTISVKTIEGTVKAIYCHYDGYAGHQMPILTVDYATQEKADALIALGDLSCLGHSAECPVGHSFVHPVPGFCVAYGRDRGERRTKAREYANVELAHQKEGQSRHYHFDGKEWIQI